MAGTTAYPGALDNFAESSPTNLGDSDGTGRTHSERHDDVEASIEAIETELGTTPSGVYSTVAARLDAIAGAGTASISLNNGTATAPSFYFTSDTNTGIWSPGADTLAVSTGGTERLRVNSSGNVGIGITSPDATLHVKSAWVSNEGQIAADVTSGGQYSGVTFQNDGTVKALSIWDNTNSRFLHALPGTSGVVSLGFNSVSLGIVYDATNNRMQFYNQAGNERFRVDADGLITGTGTSLGSFTAFTPTFNGVTLGNGTATGYYAVIGKWLFMRAELVLGSTSSVTGDMRVTLPSPYAQRNAIAGANIFHGYGIDASTGAIHMFGGIQYDLDEFTLRVTGTNGLLSTVSATNPFTWATSDIVRFAALIEV